MFTLDSSGSYDNIEQFLKKLSEMDALISADFDRYGKEGVDALSKATPKDTGKAAGSWGYRVIKEKTAVTIEWYNTDVENGFNVAVSIQYGHGTNGGGYIQGIDYINPAMRPIFERISQDIGKKVNV